MNRLIIESIEGRIMLGITMFVAIMILIGWIMINEPARMASFDEQHLGRSIEQGAELFAASCSPCHGKNGFGTANRAPALNNPQLFEYNFFAALRDDKFGSITDMQREIRDMIAQTNELTQRRDDIIAELADASDEEAAALIFERRLIDAQIDEGAELGDTEGLTDDQIAKLQDALDNNIPASIAARDAVLNDPDGLLAQRDAILDSMQTAIAKGYLPELAAKRAAIANSAERDIEAEFALTNYLTQDSSRLSQIGWGGDLRAYITTTLIHGRPGSVNVYPGSRTTAGSPQGGMVAWSQLAGGPLRQDQIDNIVNYIMNWDKGDNWTIQDLNNVQQFAKLYGEMVSGEAKPPEEAVPPREDPRFAAISELTGDAENGATLYTANGCVGCHGTGTIAPATTGTWARIESDRLTMPQFEGWSVEEYVYQSITHPNVFVVESFAPGVMPQTFADTLSDQDIADLMAYLKTQ